MVNMHRNAFLTNFDLPFIPLFSIIIIKYGELLNRLIPPVHLVVFFLDVFMGGLGVSFLIINLVCPDDDFCLVIVDGSIVGIFQMLESDISVLVCYFIIPFLASVHRHHGRFEYDAIGGGYEESGVDPIKIKKIRTIQAIFVTTRNAIGNIGKQTVKTVSCYVWSPFNRTV